MASMDHPGVVAVFEHGVVETSLGTLQAGAPWMPTARIAMSVACDALSAAVGIGIAAASSTLIQLWFRTQAKRKHFRRRQTSSRVATPVGAQGVGGILLRWVVTA